MKIRSAGIVLAILIVAAAAPVFAHHSFAAEFDSAKPVNLTGSLTKLDWINPTRPSVYRRKRCGWQSRELGNRTRSAGNFAEKRLDKELGQSWRYTGGGWLSC